ncbi:uncharacterized protein FPOAC1_013881 [Fusarium poae]|uniref:uncharacterized protein n=1 Tax=Fusarium poae TaxID=36050 RepID=UPI001D044C9C|nr:uncharacterized protein FPOAC1_013881 [Fusarium poae]KAG8664174.1 hypothetical protein FPOAC1_013881 [Fusarium poae]
MNGRRPWHEGHATASSSHPPKRRKTAHDDPEDGVYDSRNGSPASNNQYTIAWICALPIEMAAARAMLDDIHEDLPRHTNDTNTYTLGGIQGHNIVIACLPIGQYGTNNAASVLTHLIRTFPSIRLGLMVGIGGGVPGKVDMRLGDVVVGTRVVQYDLGKTIGDGQIQRTAIPKSPHHLLGTAVSSLQARHERDSSRILLILEEKFDEDSPYRRPTTADRLFSSTYEHTSPSPSCDGCDRSKLVPRNRRSTDNPVIHYGTIASGNQVMRNGIQRDNIARQLDAICFEMEAAGLMDILPCLPIRGICDYSDSHKNKEWQRYAAAAAAAYTRELVAVLPVVDVPNPYKLSSVQDDGDKQCMKDLRETDPRDDKTRIQDTKGGLLRDSYRWILDNDDFQQWRDNPQSQLLWIKGDPGKGKTMLLCGIIDELEKEPGNRLSYFFCQATEARLSNATAVLRGLIYLLVVQQPSLISHVRKKHDHAGKQLFEDGNAWEALSKILTAMLNDPGVDGAILIVDALDECKTNRHQLLDFITKPSRVKWIVSSRNWPDIEEKLDNLEQKVRLRLELNKDSISKAVNNYIGYKVNRLAGLKKYDKETGDAVQRHLVGNADGTFLWVALVCQELADPKVRKRHTLDTLKSFPPGLDPLYKRMVEHMSDSKDADRCKEILALASVVYRPITLDELKALAQSLEDLDQDELEEIIDSCGSFLTLRNGVIYFVHQSAKDFLLKNASKQILPSGIAHQHYALFSRSLGVLSETLRRNIYSLNTPGFSIDQVSPTNPDPLSPIRYSCVYWVDHLHDSDVAEVNDILRDNGNVHVFIQKKYLYWLECLGLLRSISEGTKAVHKLEALVKIAGAQKLTELLRDARRFILSHARAIEIAPLQAYASALVFSPEHSLTRELFKKEEPDWMVLKPRMEADWNAYEKTLEGHGDSVTSVVFSADGQRLASGSDDKTVKIWDAATGVCEQTLEGHGDWVRSVVFSADGQRLASGSGDNTSVTSVVFSADGQRLASGSGDNTVKIWDAATGACEQTLEGHGDWVRSVVFSADGQRLASGSGDNTVKIWDAATGTCEQTLEGHGYWVRSVVFSADGQRLASGSGDNTVKIWDAATGVCEQTLEGHGDSVMSVVFSADGQRLASGSGDNTVKIWDAATGACEQTLEGHGDWVSSVVFSADGQRLASGSDDNTVKIWDAATGACLQTLSVSRVLYHLSFDPRTNSLLYTDIGLLNLYHPALPPAVDDRSTEITLRGVRHSGWGISTSGAWIVQDGKEMLWLPPDYRGVETAVAGSTVAIGCRSGRVLVMKFS